MIPRSRLEREDRRVGNTEKLKTVLGVMSATKLQNYSFKINKL